MADDFEDLSDDPYERQVLIHDEEAPDPNDPYHVENHDLAVMLSGLRRGLSAQQRALLPYVHKGMSNKKAAEKAGCSPATVTKAFKNPHFRQCLRLLQRADMLREGPMLEQRTAMLWRIAQRNELGTPTVAIKAIEVMDRQQGVYADHQHVQPSAPQINVINYQLPNSAAFEQEAARRMEKDITPSNREFQPAQITIDG